MEWLFESLLLFHHHFGSSLATLFASRTRLERQGCHRWRQGAKCKNKLTLLDTIFHTFLHIFKTRATFFHVFSRRCSSHAFLVYLYTFSEGFSIHFACNVICARSDLDCTGMAQTHVLTSECPKKLQKDKAERCSDLELHFELKRFRHNVGYRCLP